jgi:hypothetical protein
MEPVDESASSLQFCIETGDDPTPVINAKFLLEGQLAEALNDFPAASMAYERSVDGFRLGNLWATSHRRAPKAAICFVGTICANLRLD